MTAPFDIGRLPTAKEADRLIQDVDRKEILITPFGTTKEIQSAIMRVVNRDDLTEQVRAFALQYQADSPQQLVSNLKAAHRLLRRKIRYQKDPQGKQFILHPVRSFQQGYADCKGLSIFFYHFLRALGIPSVIRFASYVQSKQIGHVYNVAIINGQAIPIDLCLSTFGVEEAATKIEDRYPTAYNSRSIRQAVRAQRNAALNGIGHTEPKWLNGALAGTFIVGFTQSENKWVKGLNGLLALYYSTQFITSLTPSNE